MRLTSVRRTWSALTVVVTLAGCWDRTVTIERTDYQVPPANSSDDLTDDVFERAPEFDPERIDSRPVEGWTVNLSAAVTTLDVDLLKPDHDAKLLKLYANYQDAVQNAGFRVLPSVNLIDGKAKQFDDGLYAALEQHWFQSHAEGFTGDLDFYQELFSNVPADSRAAAFLSVGLELAGIEVAASNAAGRAEFKREFDQDLLNTKPIGFYAWNTKLQRVYRTGRFFQRNFAFGDTAWMSPILDALRNDARLQATYRQILSRWSRLSNAPACLTILDLVDLPPQADLSEICRVRNLSVRAVALIPAGTNRESELVRRLFPRGLSSDADIMRELVRAIRSGTIDLTPTERSGWYDHQVYALETLLVPRRGEESDRLLLTANYKRRTLEAFQALMTKRKETHVLRSESGVKAAASARPLEHLAPRLRLEPAPTYFLRMARSYRFLARALQEFVGESTLAELHGLTEQGPRGKTLSSELAEMEQLFYGCYLLSAEDLGMAPNLTSEEQTGEGDCRAAAEKWLEEFSNDPDLAVDTRVIVPVANDLTSKKMLSWATIGVRFARLKASYHRDGPPRVRAAETDEWKALTVDQLESATYLIPVDEFVSVRLPRSQILTRAEFRSVCNQQDSRENVIEQLQR
ncbi:MAG: hypothetical protein JSS49_25800 [Planctomycetes bacterium]|nr:hypothetical protein [Planctomycetota bacterium]